MYDAIVVGARCAGAPTAMLLARKGYRTLVVDKARFPSDTISSHMFLKPGVLYLKRWGLLNRLIDAGTPRCFGIAVHASGASTSQPASVDWGEEGTFAPRRSVLDSLLVEAAVERGAEFRDRFTVTGLVVEDGVVCGIRGRHAGGPEVTERARAVIGADGRNSTVARLAGAKRYRSDAPKDCGVYGYFSGVEMPGWELHTYDGGGILAAPTNHGEVCIVVGGVPVSDFGAMRARAKDKLLSTIGVLPGLRDRVDPARLESRAFCWKDAVNGFRTSAGRGWALAGDAGYYKHPVTGLGMSDAFRDAESICDAVDEALSGGTSMDEALQRYARERDELTTGFYDATRKILDTPAGFAAFADVGELSRRWLRRIEESGLLDADETTVAAHA